MKLIFNSNYKSNKKKRDLRDEKLIYCEVER